jgi:hypothetical protein
MTSISRIVKIGDTDISSYVEWGPHRTKGAGRRVKTSPIIGGNRAVVWQEGRDPLTLEAGLIFRPDLADQIGDEDEITALIDDLAGDQETDRLYFGRSDRFAVVHGSVGDTEIAPAAGGAGIIRKTAEFWAEAAELYGATPTAWDDAGELPLTMAEAVENAGNLDAGLFAMEVEAGETTARPESIVLELLDDEAEVVASIALSPGLLFAEVLEVDRFGQIRQTYSDDFGSGARFAYDGFEDGTAAVADGALVIETSSYAGYALVGQWPIKRGGLLVTFTPTEAGTGEAFFETSIDQGDSWLEVSNNSRWVDGAENEIYVPQAEGYVEVWIRWRCDDAITSLSIDDLKIVQLRAVSDADVPKIPAGEERVLRVSGTGRATISAEWRDRYRP